MAEGVRRRLPLALLVTACVAAVVVAVSGAASPDGGLRLAQGGHWVANSALGLVFHVNGASGNVDARAQVPGIEPGSQVVQGETSGYVVGSSRVVEFGKSTLSVERDFTPPAAEKPVEVETAGGPYLVYREAGSVVRLGDSATTVSGGGRLGDPVATPDGTLWLHRTDSGALCRLAKGTTAITCPAAVPAGHTGSLTTIADRAVFVDTSADVLRDVSADGLGEPKPIGADLSATARIAPADADGRVAVLDKDSRRMLLVGDPPPVPVDLPEGNYSRPTPSGSSVVLLDVGRNTVLTYDTKEKRQKATPIPKEEGAPRLSRGEDKRVYVDGAEGKHVLVVDHHGQVTQVPVTGAKRPDETTASQAPPVAPPPAPSSGAQTPAGAGPPQRPATQRPATQQQPTRRPTTPSPTTQRPKTPPPVPASPPGLPPGLSTTVQGANVLVRWGAAADNGAAVTAYHVSWSPATSAGSGATHGGGVRSMQLTGLKPGTSYTVTVVAQNKAGRGAPASTQAVVPVQQTRSVTVSRGTTESYEPNCHAPKCAKMRVVMRGFEPLKKYQINPHANVTYNNPGSGQTTDRNGNLTFEAFHFGQVGATVWVVVDGRYQSNRLQWVSG
ncbi:MAG: fibronectin type III domain-containing protein [Kibdelosporangium sp.]